MKKLTALILCCLFYVATSYAQQDPLLRLFPLESTWHNPSFTASHEKSGVQAAFRNQWPELDRNPTTTFINVDHYISSINSGIGLIATFNEIGFESNTEIGFLYSYQFVLKDSITVRLGMQGSLLKKEIHWDLVTFNEPQLDPGIRRLEKNEWSPNIDLGMNVSWRNLKLGYSVKHMNEPSLSVVEGDLNLLRRHHYLSGSYDWKTSDDLTLQPGVLYRRGPASELTDWYLTSFILNRYYAGLSYANRSIDEYNVIVGYQFSKNARFMLGFEPSTNNGPGNSYETALNVSF